jgi:CRP-like cAMP-binding protein
VRASGDVVVQQGERGDAFYVVDSGALRVVVDGREVATLGPGDSFGEIALLRDGTRTATITARTPAVLWALEGRRFVATLRGGDGQALAATDQVVGALLQRARPGTDDADGGRTPPVLQVQGAGPGPAGGGASLT